MKTNSMFSGNENTPPLLGQGRKDPVCFIDGLFKGRRVLALKVWGSCLRLFVGLLGQQSIGKRWPELTHKKPVSSVCPFGYKAIEMGTIGLNISLSVICTDCQTYLSRRAVFCHSKSASSAIMSGKLPRHNFCTFSSWLGTVKDNWILCPERLSRLCTSVTMPAHHPLTSCPPSWTHVRAAGLRPDRFPSLSTILTMKATGQVMASHLCWCM